MKTIIVFRTGTLGVWREKYNGIASYAKAQETYFMNFDYAAFAQEQSRETEGEEAEN